MNRSSEIRSTLGQAEQAETTGGDGWVATYRDHVAYLLTVIQSLGDHDLHERFREQSRQLAELTRTARTQRWAIAGLTVVLVFGVLVGLATVHSEAAPRPAAAPDPVVELARVANDFDRGSAFGTYCTPWESTGTHCSSGCIWQRWCTNCIGCEWYRYLEETCRPSPGATCPFFSPGGDRHADTAAG